MPPASRSKAGSGAAAGKPPKAARPCKPPSAPKPAAARPPKRKRCRFVDDAASDTDSQAGDDDEEEEEDESENSDDVAFRDDGPVRQRRERLPRIRPEEKVVSEDELEKLKDDCVSLCGGGGGKKKKKRAKKRAYADPEDEEDVRDSDLDMLSTSSEDEEAELERTEKDAGKLLTTFLSSQGLRRPPAPADAHKAARQAAYERTMGFLKQQASQRKT